MKPGTFGPSEPFQSMTGSNAAGDSFGLVVVEPRALHVEADTARDLRHAHVVQVREPVDREVDTRRLDRRLVAVLEQLRERRRPT